MSSSDDIKKRYPVYESREDVYDSLAIERHYVVDRSTGHSVACELSHKQAEYIEECTRLRQIVAEETARLTRMEDEGGLSVEGLGAHRQMKRLRILLDAAMRSEKK